MVSEGGESDLDPPCAGKCGRTDAIEKWNRPERGSATVGIASDSSSVSEERS